MSKIRITKQFNFEMAHALHGHDSLCANVHGHSYQLRVCVSGSPIADVDSPKYGMVMDFSDLKRIVNEEIIHIFDHALVLSYRTDADVIRALGKTNQKVIILDYQPTSELMIQDFAARLQPKLPPNVQLHSLRLSETTTSYAEWFAL